LSLLYGRETFLYSLHFTPLLVVLAAFGTFTSMRLLILCLAAALVVLVGTNNVLLMKEVVTLVALRVK
jgi:hypothetical protein